MASDERATSVLEQVRKLTNEVHPHAARVTVTLDSPFDDLGIGSLELAELLRRLQDTFGVVLPSHLLASAETPRDLLRAVTQIRARSAEDIGVALPPAVGADSAEPLAASTLIEAFDWHVGATPDRMHVRILDESASPDDLTYGALRQEAAAVAAGLLACDVMPGDTVAIMLPTSRAYFVTFLGVLLAGAVPVPIYPPARPSQLPDHLRRHIGILANAGAVLLVTVPLAVPLGHLLRSNVDSLRDVVVPESLTGAISGALPRSRSVDLALVQYTSGSTGQPKGVALTHANLLANIRAMGQATAVSGADTFVSWLPLYHDMGLIGAWLGCLYFGIPLVVMAPQMFLTRPSRWLWAIHANHGTISAGPNFAYELCLSKIGDAELEGLDLSSWRLAFNGAEPVSPTTIERFMKRFAAYGLRHDAIAPVYGLAESAVGLAFPPLWRGPLIDRIDRDTFMRSGRADPAQPDDRDALRFVACGQPLPGHEIRIVDTTGHEVGDRREGRIEFRGPSATAGYFRNADATRSLFHDDWLDTGDLGYVADADLYVTGRIKDIIIRAGRNLHPEELEEVVGNLAGVRKGCVAVFGCPDPAGGPERLVVMAETRATDDETLAGVALRNRLDHSGSARRGSRRRGAGSAAYRTENLQRQDPPCRQPGDLSGGQGRWQTAAAVVGIGALAAPRGRSVNAPRPPSGGRARLRRLRLDGVRTPRGNSSDPACADSTEAMALAGVRGVGPTPRSPHQNADHCARSRPPPARAVDRRGQPSELARRTRARHGVAVRVPVRRGRGARARADEWVRAQAARYRIRRTLRPRAWLDRHRPDRRLD